MGLLSKISHAFSGAVSSVTGGLGGAAKKLIGLSLGLNPVVGSTVAAAGTLLTGSPLGGAQALKNVLGLASPFARSPAPQQQQKQDPHNPIPPMAFDIANSLYRHKQTPAASNASVALLQGQPTLLSGIGKNTLLGGR